MKDIRAAQEKALESAFKRQADLDEKLIAAGKSSTLDRSAAVFLKALGAEGYDVNDPRVQAVARERAYAAQGMAEFKGAVSSAQDRQARYELALKQTNDILAQKTPGLPLKYNLAMQRGDRAEADAIRKKVFDEQLASIPDPSKPSSTGMFRLPDLAKPEPKAASEAPAAPSASAPAAPKAAAAKQPSTQATQKTPPGLQKPPDLATISGVPKGATYGTYVAGRGWQVIAKDPQTGQLQVIGHIDPTKKLAKPKE